MVTRDVEKMNRCKLPLLLFVSLGIQTVRALSVWPLPQNFTTSKDNFSLQFDSFSFEYGQHSAAKEGCSVLDEAFRRYFTLIFPDCSHKQSFHPRTFKQPSFSLVVSVDQDDCKGYPTENSSERYNLSISKGQGTLNAESVWGALRGLESFSQLVYQDDSGTYCVKKADIQDFPRFPFRGLLLDTSRHYLPVPVILKTLDAMAYSKLNVFHWHIVDDPSFPYQSWTFPNLSREGAYHPMTHIYTQADVQKVIEHARLRGIRVLPEFDTPGHTQSWRKGQPNLLTRCYTEKVPNGAFGPVDPSLASTYDFMFKLFKELSQVFPDPYIHLGGDEVSFSCWQSNPDIQAFMEKMGFQTDFTKLEAFYMESIINMTTALNKTAVVWQDVFDYHEKIPKDTVLHIWKGLPPAYYKEMAQMTAAGLRVILAAPWYMNHIGYGQDWINYYKVKPLNFSGTEEQKKLVIGGEVAMWGEYVDATNLMPRLWPRACAAAERLWSNEEKTTDVNLAYIRLSDFRCKLIRRGIQAEPLFVGHCRCEYQGV